MKVARFALRQTVEQGELIPRFYGLAYWDFCRDLAYFYPIPLNVIIRLAREFYYILVRGLFPDTWHKAIRRNEEKIHTETWHKAWADGYKAGKVDGEREAMAASELVERLRGLFNGKKK
jgi:hypothetical protein